MGSMLTYMAAPWILWDIDCHLFWAFYDSRETSRNLSTKSLLLFLVRRLVVVGARDVVITSDLEKTTVQVSQVFQSFEKVVTDHWRVYPRFAMSSLKKVGG